jgi:hypothetical protein
MSHRRTTLRHSEPHGSSKKCQIPSAVTIYLCRFGLTSPLSRDEPLIGLIPSSVSVFRQKKKAGLSILSESTAPRSRTSAASGSDAYLSLSVERQCAVTATSSNDPICIQRLSQGCGGVERTRPSNAFVISWATTLDLKVELYGSSHPRFS